MSGLVSWPVAFAVAREKAKNGLLIALALVLCLTAGSFASGMSVGQEAFTGFGQVFLLLFTMFLGAGLVDEELQSGHAQLVLLRPVTRAAWFGGRLAGAGMVLLAAVVLAWLAGTLGAFRAGAGLVPTRLLGVPFAFAWAFAWLALLATLSVLAKGWTNAGWLVIGALGWFSLRLVVKLLDAVAGMAAKGASEGRLSSAASELLSKVQPYLGPQDPLDALKALAGGTPADLSPFCWDLLWAAAAWLLGCVLLNRRELARRPS